MNLLIKLLLACLLLLSLTFGQAPFLQAEESKFSMSYVYFGSPNTYINQVNKANNSLTTVSPNYFDIQENGSLQITWRLQTKFIDEMHRRGIKVVPFLSNHWNLEAGRNGLSRREQLARELADAVAEYNLDGINVDIEGVGASGNHSGYTRSYRDEFTDFVRILREYLPKDKELSVAVAANPEGWQVGWHGFYDYKELSKYADYLMIMSYDESWESPESPIGPVSSLSFTEKSIQYAINAGVPKEKIVNGLPFYGRIWKLDGPNAEGKPITGKGVSHYRIPDLLDTFQAIIAFDEKSQTPYATFTVGKEQSYALGSILLTEGKYEVWFENERSLKAKLRLITEYGIHGAGSWALSMEDDNIWDFYTLWLNGNYFNDVVANHWAEESILTVSNLGWMEGLSSVAFGPSKNLTRAEGAVILVRALGFADAAAQETVFTDTKNHWAHKEIEIARELGIIEGMGNNKFAPKQPLTREQLATILYNIFEYDVAEGAVSPFPDVTNTARYSYTPIVAIAEKGYITGFDDGSFQPNGVSTRAQMAQLMAKMKEDFQEVKLKKYGGGEQHE